MASSRKLDDTQPHQNGYFILIFMAYIFRVLLVMIKKSEKVIIGKARAGLLHRDQLVQRLTNKALNKKNGIATARLGLPIYGLHSNLTLVVPTSTAQMLSLVKEIEAQAGGRKVLQPLAEMVQYTTMANMTLKEGAKDQRKLLTVFTKDVTGFKAIGREMFASALHAWSHCENGIVLLDEVKFLVRSMTAKRIIGAELTREENNILENALREVKSRTTSLSPFASSEFRDAQNRYREFAAKLVSRICDHIIEGVKSTSIRHSFLSEIIKKMTDYKETQQDEEKYIHHPLVTSAVLVIATGDGIYTNLTSILLLLLKHTDVREKLFIELSGASEDGINIDDEMLKDPRKLPYLHQVYLEALRYNSSLPFLARYTVDGIHADNIDIPAHSNILINLRALHFDKKRWGEDADEFIPERFNRPGIKEYKISEVPFLPFSLGHRQCPGQKVGEEMIKLFLSQFILNYSMEPLPNQAPPIVVEVSLAPDPGPGYKVRVSEMVRQEKELRIKM